MKKNVRNVLIMAAVLVVLGAVVLLLVLFPAKSGEENSSAPSSQVSQTGETLVERDIADFETFSVTQGGESYTIVPKGDELTLQGYEDFDLVQTQLQVAVKSLMTVTAAKDLGSQSSLEAFGLTGDEAVTVSMTFRDGTSEKLVLGKTAAETAGRYLLKDGAVYIVSGISENLYGSQYKYFNTEMYSIPSRTSDEADGESGSFTEETDILYSMKLSGTNFPQELEVQYDPSVLGSYLMTAPVTAESGGDKFTALIATLKTMTADSIAGAKLTPELLAEFGLDEPMAVVEFDLNSQKHTLQASKKDGQYYVLLDDNDLIYQVAADSVTPWAETTLRDMRMSYIWLNNIQEVDRLTLTVGEDRDYIYHITRTVNEENSTELRTDYDLTIKTADGKEIEYTAYQQQYQDLLSITVLSSDPAEYESSNAFRIEYHRFDGGKDVIEFRPAGEDRYAALLNGGYNGLVRKNDVDKIISSLDGNY